MPDAVQDAAAPQVFRLMYRSRSRIPAEDRRTELGALFSQARSTNKRRAISGALLVHGDWFVQVLEGEESAVRDLLDRISGDPRHEEVTLLESGPVASRVFARWAMARVSDDGQPDIPLIAHTDGISPAAGRGTTPEQDEVLDRMRSALRATPQNV
jgi:hypothetical protein